MTAFPRVVLGALVLAVVACSGSDGLTARDVYMIVDEVDVAMRAEVMVEPAVLIASAAAVGAATPEEAATRVADALLVACATVVRTDATNLAIDYAPSTCGRGSDIRGTPVGFSFAGHGTMHFSQVDGANTVDHTWTGLSDGHLAVDGTAHVTTTSSADTAIQHVQNHLSWVRASDGKTGLGDDDRTWPIASPLDQTLPAATGHLTWESDLGSWELRPVDARYQAYGSEVPWSGTFAIVTPANLALTLSLTVGQSGPRMTLTDGHHSYSFDFTPKGVTPR